jgi:simple sugar transport system permease protein
MDYITNIIFVTLRVSTPLILAAMAGVLSQQVNLLNIAIEGLMLVGAFVVIVAGAALGNIWLGLLAAVLVTIFFSWIFGLFVIDFKANLIVSGLALNILAVGAAAYLLVVLFNSRGAYSPLGLGRLPTIDIPIIENIPIIGPIFSGHGVLVYVSWLSILVTSLLLYRTPLGIHIRAVGEHVQAAETAGIAVKRVQYFAVLSGGLLCALAGAQLSAGELGLFTDDMTAGRGFIALAAVFFGRARPGLTTVGCLVFGLFDALQIRLQVGTGLPPQIPAMLPYLTVIIMLTLIAVRDKVRGKTY